ncbi:hypothetical protein M5362_15720 [Streptomyces sp. Je 1-79]|uniref:hypothetical protein n=1 Tax=Streptomyces sp. Je 1-79 TaxID=2943847 RepID=UPI0021A2A35E|nr:hypothetical protein [Streptomyces sp. Je 1-79]MCT4354581.1 hypothetical protein [Streptomyces sp. Je 1-79]
MKRRIRTTVLATLTLALAGLGTVTGTQIAGNGARTDDTGWGAAVVSGTYDTGWGAPVPGPGTNDTGWG